MNSAGPRPQGSATGKQKQVPGILEAAEKRGCGLEETLEWIFRARLRGPRTQFSGRLSQCSTGDAGVCSLLLSCRPASPSAPKLRPAPAPAPGRLRDQAPPPRPHVIAVPASAKRGPPLQVLAAGPRPASLLPLPGGAPVTGWICVDPSRLAFGAVGL